LQRAKKNAKGFRGYGVIGSRARLRICGCNALFSRHLQLLALFFT